METEPRTSNEEKEVILKRVNFTFTRTPGGDDIDHDTYMTCEIRKPGALYPIAAATTSSGSMDPFPIPLDIVTPVNTEQIKGVDIYAEIKPNGHDKYDFTLDVVAEFSDLSTNRFSITSRLGNHDGYPHFLRVSGVWA